MRTLCKNTGFLLAWHIVYSRVPRGEIYNIVDKATGSNENMSMIKVIEKDLRLLLIKECIFKVIWLLS